MQEASHHFKIVVALPYCLGFTGSIVVDFVAEGPVATLDTTIDEIWDALRGGLTLNYGGYTLTAARYLVVNGQDFHDDDSVDDDDDAEKKVAVVMFWL